MLLRTVVILFIFFHQSSAIECGRDWLDFDGNCYKPGESRMTWYDAEDDCQQSGAHLPSIHNEKEKQFIHQKFNLTSIWLGLHRVYNWSWMDGSTFDSDEFSLEPSKGDGLFYSINANGDWYNYIDRHLRYICEAKANNFTCDIGWRLYNDENCFYFSNNSLKWNKAEEDCMKRGGHLTSINNMKEYQFIQNILKNLSLLRDPNEPVWIGLYDAIRFTWTDNSPFVFSDFDRFPLKPSTLFCVKILSKRTYNSSDHTRWLGDYCSNQQRFICKKNTERSRPGGEVKCDVGWIYYNNKCYYLSNILLTWYEADRWCHQNSSQLVSINDENENNFIKASLSERRPYWIGINLWRSNSKWSDNTEYNYDNFGKGKPSGYGYVTSLSMTSSNVTSSWSDLGWNAYLHYVCQKSKVSCPDELLTFQRDPSIQVKFPRTKYGRTTTSMEKCPHKDIYYGVRSCNERTMKWDDPIWLSSCEASLKNLTFVTESNIGEVASDLMVMTSQPTMLTSDDVDTSLNTVEYGLKLSASSNQNLTSLYVDCMSNLIKATATLDKPETSQRVLVILDEIVESVDVRNESFMRTSQQVAVYVASPSPSSSSSDKQTSVGFEFQQTSDEYEGFEANQLQIVNKENHKMNNSYIYIDFNTTSGSSPSTNERYSFYAFADDSIFKRGQSSSTSSSTTTAVNSQVVLSATTSQGIHLNKVSMRFIINNIGDVIGSSKCGYWNEIDLKWMEFEARNISSNFIECEVEHLTNFASLFSYTSDLEENIGLTVLTYIGCTISIIGQIATLALYFKPKTSLSQANYAKARGVFLCNLAFSLLIFSITLLLSEVEAIQESVMSCKIIAIILHFGLLSVFTWMTVDTINIFVGSNYPFYYRVHRARISYFAFVIGWGIPTLLITIFVAMDNNVYGADSCWVHTSRVMNFVIIPTAILLGINFILFTFIFYAVKIKSRPSTSQANNEERWKTVNFAFLLFFMIGGTWIFGFCISPFADISETLSLVFAYIFTIFNSLQGAALFALYYVRSVEKKKNTSSSVRYTVATRLKETNQINYTN